MTTAVTVASRTFHVESNATLAAERSRAQLDLTASDGVGLVLVSLSARVVIEDPLAFTELTLVFQNPEQRQLEGRFRIGLPPGASVSRFAMKIGGAWQEGEVVERQAARRAYEDFLHRRQDPALLEHEAGNEFSARVFPIEAGERKELILSYSHEIVKEGDAYRLPLIGLPRIEDLSIRALVGRSGGAAATTSLGGTASSWQVVEVQKQAWTPDIDFEVRLPASGRTGLRHKNLAVVRAKPVLPSAPDEIASLLLLVDTSASRALGYDRQLAVVNGIVRALGLGANPSVPVAIACFDQAVDVLYEGTAGAFDQVAASRLAARLPLGASDLEGALSWASSREGARYERVLLISDAVATAGQTASEKLVAAAKGLSRAGVQRMDALAVGGLRDDACLRRLVTAGLSRDGTVCDADAGLAEIGRKLLGATRSNLRVEVPGAEWVWPTTLNGVQPGDAALVYADVPEDKPVRLLLDGEPMNGGDLPLDPAERPLLLRAWIKGRIERLEDMRSRPDTDPDVRAGLQKQIIDLSVKNRVLSPYTALLVLETEADYERYQIDRSALSDILTVGLSGVELLKRTASSVPVAPRPEMPKAEIAAPKKKKMAARPRPADDAAPAREMERRELTSELVDPIDFGGEGAAAPAMAMADEPMMDAMESEPEEEVVSALRGRSPMVDPLRSMDMPRPAAGPPPGSFAQRPAAMAPPPPAMAPMAPPPPPAMGPMSPPSPGMPLSPSPMSPPSPMPLSSAAAPPPPARSGSVFSRVANAVSDAVSSLVERISPSSPDSPAPDDDQGETLSREGVPPAAPLSPTPVLSPSPGPAAPPPDAAAAPPPPPPTPPVAPPVIAPEPQRGPSPEVLESWNGPFREVMSLVLSGKGKEALDLSIEWRRRAPGDVLALVGVGEAAELLGAFPLAARAYGSIIDLFPSRADLRRFAGERLSRLTTKAALDLAIDTYKKAVESRPDHPSCHRLLGMALLRAGRFSEAFEAIAVGQARTYPDKFPGIPRILSEDLGLAAAAWIKAEPEKKDLILSRLRAANAKIEHLPSVRFVLVWETDANDVDFHIYDGLGGHAYFRERALRSGGELYADVTQGYGPECFTIQGAPHKRTYPYRLQAHYYRQGPMGYGMGALQIIEHDGKGGVAFAERPYVVMKDGAFVDLGVVTGPLKID